MKSKLAIALLLLSVTFARADQFFGGGGGAAPTAVPPVATATPAPTVTPVPTATPIPPVATVTPVPTSTPAPTATPEGTLYSNSTGQNALSGSTTAYIAPIGAALTIQSDEFLADVRPGQAATTKNLYCSVSTAQLSTTSVAITVRNNHADTGVTCTITGGASTCNDTTHTGAISANNALTLKVVTLTLTGSPTLRCGLIVTVP